MILCLGTTPAAQRVMVFQRLSLDTVNRAVRTLDGAAGKAVNVAKVLKTLGQDSLVTGFIGGPRGHELERLLQARQLATNFVHVQTPTRQCVTVIDEANGTITELVEESQPVAPAAYEELLRIVAAQIERAQVLVMSGTIAAGGPADLYLRCAELAHTAGALTIADASGTALIELLKARPGLVKPNLLELEATVGRRLTGEASICEAMQEMHIRGAQRVIITAGGRPSLAFDGQTFWRITAPPVKVVNPIGSGDAFTAGFAWKLALGAPFSDACCWGCAAGTANTLTWMAGEVELTDVKRLAERVKVERI